MTSIYYFQDDGKISIPYLNDFSKYFCNKNIFIYGGCESGKTTLVNEIYEQKNLFQLTFKFTTNLNYTDKKAIKLNNESINLLEIMFFKQKDTYNKIKKFREMNILKTLFDLVADEKEKIAADPLQNGLQKRFETIGDAKSMDPGAYHAEIKHIRDGIQEICEAKYAECIERNIDKLKDLSIYNLELNNEECKLLEGFIVTNNTKFKHQVLVIFDEAEEFIGKNADNKILQDIFSNGRHFGITNVVTAITEKSFPPFLRRNAHANIFTTPSAAVSHFMTVSNGYDKETRRKSDQIIERVFKADYGLQTYRKLVFFRNKFDSDYQFQCILAKSPVNTVNVVLRA
jgi:hypothetical protein